MKFLVPDWLLHPERNELLVFTLVVIRISGLVAVGPPLGTNELPVRVRALFVLALSFLVTPLCVGGQAHVPTTTADFCIVAAGELLVGVTLGVGMLLLFSGIQLAGSLISTIGGVSAADLFNPGTNSQVPLFSQLFYLMAIAIYFAIGGHLWLIEGLLDTFTTIPPGHGSVSDGLVDTLVTLASESMALGIRAGAPATVALLLATLVLGLMSRTLPQLNLLMFGFGVNAAVTFGVLLVSLGSIAWLFQDQVESTIQTLFEELPAWRGEGSLF